MADDVCVVKPKEKENVGCMIFFFLNLINIFCVVSFLFDQM